MKAEIKVPAVGESISEATIGEWTKKTGEFVKRDEVILLLETDKASVEVVAPNDGVLTIKAKAGDVVKIGAVVADIDTEGTATATMAAPSPSSSPTPKGEAPAVSNGGGKTLSADMQQGLSPAVRRVVDESGVDPLKIQGTGKDGRLIKEDVMHVKSASATASPAPPLGTSPQKAPVLPKAKTYAGDQERIKRVPMSNIRKKTAERLVQAQHNAAILTTFNEVDMTELLKLRDKYKDAYKKKYDVSLGFMGFFVKACIEALKSIPQVNGSIDGTDIIFKNYFNIGVAVGTEKGLVVPTVKDADRLSIAEIETAIKYYALKARDGKISIDDLADGTFTISNGGVFGSLMSTPILNAPQSAILGMHKVQDRPVAIDGKVEIRPMMYLALSYDHRMIDGKEAVTFLVKVKDCIEDPNRILLEI